MYDSYYHISIVYASIDMILNDLEAIGTLVRRAVEPSSATK